MNVRTIALAVPLALGMACMHTQGEAATGSASTATPSQQPQASAGTATQDPIMQPGPAVQGHAGDEIVSGRIASVAGDTVSIQTQQGGTRTLQVVPQTDVQVDGQDASFQDLAAGQDVRASFDTVGGQDVAVKIHAGQVGAQERTGTGSGAPTDQGTAPSDQGTSGGTGSGAMPPAPTAPPATPSTPPDTGTGQGASGPPSSW